MERKRRSGYVPESSTFGPSIFSWISARSFSETSLSMTRIWRTSTVNSTEWSDSLSFPSLMGALIWCSWPRAENIPVLNTRTVIVDFCTSISLATAAVHSTAGNSTVPIAKAFMSPACERPTLWSAAFDFHLVDTYFGLPAPPRESKIHCQGGGQERRPRRPVSRLGRIPNGQKSSGTRLVSE